MSSLNVPASADSGAPPSTGVPLALPQTAASGRLLRAIPAAVLAGLMGYGLYAAVAKGVGALAVQDLAPASLLDGEHRKALSATLTSTDYADAAARLGREADWLVMRDLGPQVRQGCPGWLFLADEFRQHRDAAVHSAQRAGALARVGHALSRRGVRLLVVVVPDKSRIEAAQLCGFQRPVAFADRASTFVQQVQAGGVQVVDLTRTLEQSAAPPFLRTDTHWNETGSSLAADAVAAGVRGTGIAIAKVAPPQITAQAATPREGDLVRLAGIERLPQRLQPSPDVVPQSTVAAAAAGGADDLFGDAALPQVALVGTSFSRNANFAPLLATALGSAVAGFAKDGGDFSGAAQAYFASAAFRQNPPLVLIWELPERVIQMPPGSAEAAWLPVAQLLDAARLQTAIAAGADGGRKH